MFWKKNNIQELTDIEIVEGLQNRDVTVERKFYLSCQRYFNECRGGVLDFRGGAQAPEDLFQDSFIRIWQEIEARRIFVRDNYTWRTDRNGNNRKLSASLKTYFMAIAKYRNYEMIREEDIYAPEEFYGADMPDVVPGDELPDWIVEQCVNDLPPGCKEILTLFYYDGKSLDEILEIRNENQSKNGLKTGKSKCLKNLKDRISEQFERFHLKPYRNV